MKKVIIQGLIIIASFFASWLVLDQVNWMRLFKVEQTTKKTEEKLGELFLDVFKNANTELDSGFVRNAVDTLLLKICTENGIERNRVRIHILDNSEVNAFALPDGHLIMYSGLLRNSENPEELAGVICHEIAHIELDHVMKKLIREIGLSVLFSATTGTNNPEIIKEAARMLSSSSFDRNMERDADLKAVDYLINADIDPEPFATFLYRLQEKEGGRTSLPGWISTHPASEERAKYIIDYCKEKSVEFSSALRKSTWEELKENIRE